MAKCKWQAGMKSALVDVSAMADDMDDEPMVFLLRCIDNPIASYADLVEFPEFTCESVGRKIFEVLR
jgi:hypothetical protein